MKFYYSIFYLLFFLLSFSCKKTRLKEQLIKISKEINKKDTIHLTLSDGIIIDAPTSIKKNEYFSGVLKYNPTIDTIQKSDFVDRLIILYISKDHSNFENFKKYKITSYLDTSRTGNFNFKLKFDTIGKINVIFTIEDLIVLKYHKRKEMVREITLEKRMSYPLLIKE